MTHPSNIFFLKMLRSTIVLVLVLYYSSLDVNAFSPMVNHGVRMSQSMGRSALKYAPSSRVSDIKFAAKEEDPKKAKEPEKEGLARLLDLLEKEDAKDPKKKSGPPIYTPGNYGVHAAAALAYVIPIVDASDLGKYMFEAYPNTADVYNTIFGAAAAIYNGVPFLPFAVFFLMSYICRAPTFPVEVRFHFAQAFMLSIIQFLPSLGFGLLEKAGVPGLAVLYNTVFLWVMLSCVIMQVTLLNPLSSSKNPFLINVVGWAMRYMNYTTDMKPK